MSSLRTKDPQGQSSDCHIWGPLTKVRSAPASMGETGASLVQSKISLQYTAVPQQLRQAEEKESLIKEELAALREMRFNI